MPLTLSILFKKTKNLPTQSKLCSAYSPIYSLCANFSYFPFRSPLWWGVLDFREENVSPSPSLPRAKNFLSENEFDRLLSMTESAIQEESEKISKSAITLLEALLLSEIVSIQLLAKECGARGVVGVRDLLQKSADKMQVNKINYVLS